jgi:hypothetical protein
VGGVGEDGEGVSVRDGGGDGGEVVGVEAAVGRAGGAVAGGVCVSLLRLSAHPQQAEPSCQIFLSCEDLLFHLRPSLFFVSLLSLSCPSLQALLPGGPAVPDHLLPRDPLESVPACSGGVGMSVQARVSCALPALDHAEAKPVLFMLSVTAPPLNTPAEKGASRAPLGASTAAAARTTRGSAAAAASSVAPTAPPPLEALPPSGAVAAGHDICCLEGCGLRWRVRPPPVRRNAWTVTAQRMRLCIEALGGAKIERVFTLLDQHEVAPCLSYELAIGDMHAGDTCHVPVLIWLPALASALPSMDAVRFSFQYVDALKIDTRACELCGAIGRPDEGGRGEGAAPGSDGAGAPPLPPLPIGLDRERNRVLVTEALQRAAMVANSGELDGACNVLSETMGMLSRSPSVVAGDALAGRLVEVVGAALRRLDEALAEFHKSRGGSQQLAAAHQ